MQWDKVERIPAVVALKVMASPLKSIPFIPLGLAGGHTGADGNKGVSESDEHFRLNRISGYKQRTNDQKVFDKFQLKKKTFADWLTLFFAAVVVVIVFSIGPGSKKFIFILLCDWLKQHTHKKGQKQTWIVVTVGFNKIIKKKP